MTPPAGHRAREGLSSSRRHPRYVPRPICRRVLRRLHFQVLGAFHGLRPDGGGSALPDPHPKAGYIDDAAGFASCYGPHLRSPFYRAFDTGLRRRTFPSDTASLLPGLLATTRTGLPPASDDELANEDQPPTQSTSTLLGARNGSLWLDSF